VLSHLEVFSVAVRCLDILAGDIVGVGSGELEDSGTEVIGLHAVHEDRGEVAKRRIGSKERDMGRRRGMAICGQRESRVAVASSELYRRCGCPRAWACPCRSCRPFLSFLVFLDE